MPKGLKTSLDLALHLRPSATVDCTLGIKEVLTKLKESKASCMKSGCRWPGAGTPDGRPYSTQGTRSQQLQA